MTNKKAMILAGAILMGAGIFLFAIGLKNFDSGHNMHWMECQYNTQLVDYSISASGEQIPMETGQLVMVGMTQMIISMWMVLIGSIELGYYVGTIKTS